MTLRNDLLPVGWEEWVALPELNLPAVRAKVDTGAQSSCLNAYNIEVFQGDNGQRKVRFIVQPLAENPDLELVCVADLVAQREVKSSNGEKELRCFIKTSLSLGGREWEIELSLTNRDRMAFPMLLGRSAMEGHLVVDPNHSYLQGILSPELYQPILQQGQDKKPLKVCILSREPDCYSTQRLAEEGRLRGHFVDIIDTNRCYIHMNSDKPEVHYAGQALENYDVVIPRIGASITFYGTAVVRQFEAMGVFCLNGSIGIQTSRDKLHAHQILAARGIPTPKTSFAHSPNDTSDLIKLTGTPPLVLKLLQGSQGRGVVLAETKKAAESVIGAFQGLHANFLVQEFIKEAKGEDLRCFVVGNKVVASMMRKSSEDDFRSNLHQGGQAMKVKLTAIEKETAIKAAKALHLNVAGVDIVRAHDGPRVLEVNSSPGLEGIEKTSGKNITESIYLFAERQLSRGRRLKPGDKLPQAIPPVLLPLA